MSSVCLNGRAASRIINALNKGIFLSAQEISKEAFVAFTSLSGGGYLKAMKNAGMIYIAGWRRTKSGFSTPLYSAGNKEDCPRPLLDDSNRMSAGLIRILEALEKQGPMTYREIAVAAHISHITIKNAKYMNVLLAQKKVHICGWRRAKNGPMSAIYEEGAGHNTKRPAAISKAEHGKNNRLKNKILSATSQSHWAHLVASLQG